MGDGAAIVIYRKTQQAIGIAGAVFCIQSTIKSFKTKHFTPFEAAQQGHFIEEKTAVLKVK